mgnify:FL=1|jgi:hypothetical protein
MSQWDEQDDILTLAAIVIVLVAMLALNHCTLG